MPLPTRLMSLPRYYRIRQLKNSAMVQNIEAEYTVITDTTKKDP
jgi:hypothetical protein